MKNEREAVVLTTLFELEWNIAYEFFNSLNKQDVKNFDILVVNDGFTQLDKIREIFSKLNIIEICGVSSIAKNREILIRHARKKYLKGIFCDFDDYFSMNRISLSIEELNKCDIVFNDLTIFRDDQIIQANRFSNDFPDSHVISISDLLQKNYLGLSNTAMNLVILDDLELSFDSTLIAVDWYLFSVLMLKGHVAKFTNKAITYYRQHTNNIANIGDLNCSQIINEMRVKRNHYIQMSKKDGVFCFYLDALELFSKDFFSNMNDRNELIFKSEDQAWWSLIQLNIGEA